MNRTLRRVRLATPLAALVAATAFAAPSAPSPAEAEQPALLLVGDSTLAPRSGYGDALCERLAPGWACLNLARGGRSTKSYREEGLWERVIARLRTRQGSAPHVVLIQFGHNDQPGKPGRSTDLATEFPANLRRYVEEVRAAGGLPVLGTPLTRRSFKEGRLQGDLEPWAETTRRVARELDVPLVDTLGTSAARVQALGEAVADTLAVAAKPTPGEAPGRGSNSFDRTHVGPRGACLFAALSAPLLAQAVPELRGAFASSGPPDEAACLALPPPPPAAALGQASELHRGTYTMPGWAVGTQGGRGGRVLRVTHLQASGPGSLRAALEAHGPRNIVFEVGGVIDLQGGKLDIREPFVTIAGQTAPAPGITLIKGEVRVGTHDVIVQHLRFRPGAWGRPARSGGDQDGLSTGAGAHQVIVDHCSFSWATDENLSVGGPRFPGSTPDEWRRHTGRAITFSHNLIYEGLGHSVHTKGEHSKGTLIHDNATGILLHANLYASNRERNALFKGGVHAAMVNNLIYNPGARAVHYNLVAHEWSGREPQTGQLSLVANAYRQGPDTRAGLPLFTLGGQGDVALHLRGNLAVDAQGQALPMTGGYTSGSARILATETPNLPAGLRWIAAERLEQELPLAVGARPWARDPIDFKLLSDVAEGRGKIIDSELENAQGYPQYAPTRRAFDPNDWNLDDMSPRAGWDSLFRNGR